MNKDDKPEIINRAKKILHNSPRISIAQAIAIAASTFALGIPTGAVLHNLTQKTKQTNETSISEEATNIIEKNNILNVKFPNNSTSSNMIIIENEEELGDISATAIDVYDKFQTSKPINIRFSPSTDNDKLIMHKIKADEQLYINMNDNTIYNPYDSYTWKPAIYEKDGKEYDGYVAVFDEQLLKVLDATSLKAKVKEDTQINFYSDKDKKIFNDIERNTIIRADEEYKIQPPSDYINEETYITYYENPIYSLIEDKTPDRPVVHGYKDVKITDEDIKLISNFTASWENAPLYNYLSGTSDDYNNIYVSSCITQDRKNYICYIDGLGYSGDNSARNYGFGVNISQINLAGYREKNQDHVKTIEEKYGYDMNDENLLIPSVSLMPVHVIDEARENYLKERVENVKSTLKEYDIYFTKSEILALAAISYQCGADRIPNLIDNYAKWGNSKNLRRNFVYAGYNPFEYALGTTAPYNGYDVGREFTYWRAFHDGEFIFTNGEVKNINDSLDIRDELERD